MDATGSGAEAKTKNLQNRGLKRRTSANNGFEKEENDSNSEELLQLQWSNHSNAFGAAMSKLRLSTCSLVFFSWLLGSRDLSQDEGEISLCKAEQIHKMSTIFTQK